jgi:hypothetical protein
MKSTRLQYNSEKAALFEVAKKLQDVDKEMQEEEDRAYLRRLD